MIDRYAAVYALMILLTLPSVGFSQDARDAVRTVLDGVYTNAQAERGLAAYASNCRACHNDDLSGLNGPPLKGERFMERWREFYLDTLFTVMRDNMPPNRSEANRPKLPDTIYLDIFAYILKENSSPRGESELTIDVLTKTMLVGKDGPKPVPNGAMVQVVGCLAKAPGQEWILVNVTEPIRTKTPDVTNTDEIAASKKKPLGTHTFRLQNLDYLGSNFDPAPHDGHKIQVKGLLVRQPNRERINITSFEMVDASCTP
jgi:quinoprotein glucose dehydrogenase